MWRNPDVVVDHILWNHFPPVRRGLAREPLQRLFRSCGSRRIAGSDGVLKQALVLAYPGRLSVPHACPDEALLYVMLERGTVFGLAYAGDVPAVVDKLPEIARFLEKTDYDARTFTEVEAGLAALLRHGLSTSCSVRLLRHAPVAPDHFACDYIVRERCREAFSDIQTPFGYAGDCFLSAEVLPFLERQFDPDGGAIAAFRSGLDRTVLDLLDQLVGPYTRRTAQLAVYNYLVGRDAIQNRNRAQALTELPWLLPLVTDMEVDDWRLAAPAGRYPVRRRATLERPMEHIRRAIDAGQPLFDAVASNLAIRKETVRWSRRMVLPNTGYFGCFDVDLLLVALSWLSTENRPSTPPEWQRFAGILCDCVAIVCAFNYRYEGTAVSWSPPERSLTVLRYPPLASALSHWVPRLFKKDRHARPFRCWEEDRQHRKLARVPDFLAALYDSIRRFCLNNSRAHTRFDQDAAYLQSWLTTQDITDVLRRSEAFHRAVGASAADARGMALAARYTGTPGQAAHWQSVLEQPFCWGGRAIVELCSTQELVEDGEAMQHCAGTYTGRCTREHSLVFSVRDAQQQRCSTFELKIDPATGVVIVAAHVGPQNSAPDALCDAAVTRFVRQLNTPTYRGKLWERVQRTSSTTERTADLRTLLAQDPDAYEWRVAEIAWRCAFDTEATPLACYLPLR